MYQFFNALITCEFPLPGLARADGPEPDIRIILAEDEVDEAGYTCFHSWREPDDELFLACSRRDEADGSQHYLLRFPEGADFVIRGNTIACHPHAACDESSLRHMLLDQVIPRYWAHRGHLVLHAGAVQLPDQRVIALLGESGWGKSTLGMALEQGGGRLLSDDCISLRAEAGGVRLIPSYTGLRLYEDSITTLGLCGRDWSSVAPNTSKKRLELSAQEEGGPLWLDVLYVMSAPTDAGKLSINPLPGADLITQLIEHSFLLDVRDKQCAARQFREAGAVMRALSRVCSLDYPRDYAQLPSVCEAIAARAV